MTLNEIKEIYQNEYHRIKVSFKREDNINIAFGLRLMLMALHHTPSSVIDDWEDEVDEMRWRN